MVFTINAYSLQILELQRGLPISCFLNEVDDNMQSIIDIGISEVCNLMALGVELQLIGQIFCEIGAAISTGKTGGYFIKKSRDSSYVNFSGFFEKRQCHDYLNISHPEIQEFIAMRKANGGDVE